MNPLRLRAVAGALAASFIMTSFYAFAEDDVSQLKQQVDELDQKIRVLQRQRGVSPIRTHRPANRATRA